jgi:hypothetical protein
MNKRTKRTKFEGFNNREMLERNIEEKEIRKTVNLQKKRRVKIEIEIEIDRKIME